MTKLDETLQVLIDTLKTTKDFIGDQAPKVVQELLNYVFFNTIYSMVIDFIIVSICIYFIKKCSIKVKEDDIFVFPLVALMIIALIFSIDFMFDVNSLIKLKIAPRIVIIDYLKSNLSK